MENIDKPKVVVSECLGFSACRYNGQTIPDKFVARLQDYVEYKTVCPEVEIGLGVPRTPVRLISEKDEIFLYQPASDEDYTKEMMNYSINCLDALQEVDGFILKGRSPSCGIKDVKVYLGKEKTSGSMKGIGIFASQVLLKYPYSAIEEEGRLTNFRIREHFLTKLYLMFRLRQVEETKSMAEIVKFQSDNKYLLMAYSQKGQKLLGRIVANHEKQSFNLLIDNYRNQIGSTFASLPRYSNYINTLMHIFGHFSEKLSSSEKKFILDAFEKYKKGNIPLSVPINLLKSHAIEYEQIYLLDQTIWEPFPQELMDIRDTGSMDDR